MSKLSKISIYVLGGLVVVGLTYAGFTYLPEIINKPGFQLSTINEPIAQLTKVTKEDAQISEDIPEDNQIQQENIDQELDGQIPSPPPTCNPNWKCGTWSICTNSLQTRTCVDANSCGVLINKPSVAQSCTIACTTNWQCGSWGTCSNSIQTRICSDLNSCGNNNGEPTLTQSCSISQTPTTTTDKNYYANSVYKVRTLITIYNSYKTWLQDTSDQFRSASLTLAGYSTGGLYGETRDAAIDLANAEISVISSLLTNTNQWISYWEGALNVLNSQPEQFVKQSTFDSMQQTPAILENEIAGIKSDINSHLDSVMAALKYH